MLKTKYDAVIAGAGPAGLLAANVLADAGASVLLLEADRRHMGGNGIHHAAQLLNVHDKASARVALQHYRYTGQSKYASVSAPTPASVAEIRQWSLDKFDAFETAAPAVLKQLKEWGIALQSTTVPTTATGNQLPAGIGTCAIAPADTRSLPAKYRKKLRQLANYALFNRVHMPQSGVHAASAGSAYGMLSVTASLLRYFFDYPWRLRSTRDRRACDGAALVSQLIVRLLDRENVTFAQYAQLSNILFSHRQVMAVEFVRAKETMGVETNRLILATGDHLQDADYAQAVFGSAFAARQTGWNTQYAGAALADGVELAELAGAQCIRMHEVYGRLVHAPAHPEKASPVTPATAVDYALAQPDCLLIEPTGRRVQAQHKEDYLAAYERAFNTLYAQYEQQQAKETAPTPSTRPATLPAEVQPTVHEQAVSAEPMQLDLLAENGEHVAAPATGGDPASTTQAQAQMPAQEPTQSHTARAHGQAVVDNTSRNEAPENAVPRGGVSGNSVPNNGNTEVPLFAIFDSRFREKKPFGSLLPANLLPDDMLPASYWQNLLFRADTPAELAACIGIDAIDLERALAAHNRLAKEQEARAGNADNGATNTSIVDAPDVGIRCAVIGTAPFYAAPIFPGHAGCRGGVKTNADGQVMSSKGYKINGLYAVGGCAASALGEYTEAVSDTSEHSAPQTPPEIDGDILEFTETLVTAYRAALHAVDLPLP